jgi:hypothetical protein
LYLRKTDNTDLISHMKRSQQIARSWGGAVMALAFCVAASAPAGASTTAHKKSAKRSTSSIHKSKTRAAKSATHHTATRKTAAHSAHSTAAVKKSGVKNIHSKRKYSARSSRARRAAIRMKASRIEEIQQALIREGYLTGEPSGSWDATTHVAMQRYQQANNFSPTGLPDAKSLMKLGLGPHALPEDLQPAATAQAAASGPAQPEQ